MNNSVYTRTVDTITATDSLKQRLLQLPADHPAQAERPVQAGKSTAYRVRGGAAAAVLVLVLGIWGGGRLLSTFPPDSNLSNPPIQSNSVTYHDIDPSGLRYDGSAMTMKVPIDYWAVFRVQLLYWCTNLSDDPQYKNDVSLGEQVSWDETPELTYQAISEALGTAVKEPDIPVGDCILKKYVLTDNINGKIIACRMNYIYFEPETSDWINSFEIIYLPMKDFSWDSPDCGDSPELSTEGFYTPRHPYKQELSRRSGEIIVVVEATARWFTAGAEVWPDCDEEKTLLMYEKTNNELSALMKSIF